MSDSTDTSLNSGNYVPIAENDGKEPFYTSEDSTKGTHEGWIANPDTSQTLLI